LYKHFKRKRKGREEGKRGREERKGRITSPRRKLDKRIARFFS